MKILLVHHRLPYPSWSGMDKATTNLIRILSSHHDLTLIFPIDYREKTERDVEAVRKFCPDVIPVQVKSRTRAMGKRGFWYWWRFIRLIFLGPNLVTEYFYSAVANEIRRVCQREKFDVVQAISLASAGYLRFAGSIPRVLIAHEVHFNLTRSQICFTESRLAKLMLWLNYHAYRRYEKKIYSHCDFLLALSDVDLQKIKFFAGKLRYSAIVPGPFEEDDLPNSTIARSMRCHDPNKLVFVGGLGPAFNRDAVLYFSREIFPRVKKAIPEVELFVVGENPPREIRDLERVQGIRVTGRVPDVRPYIERAAVYVAPTRYGGGVKSKIIEALAMGKAIVGTSVAFAGLHDIGEDVFRIQDSPEGFADEIVRLVRNPELRFELGSRARELFEKSYSIEVVGPKILDIYEEIGKALVASR